MALTQISTNGIKNGTITGSDLATNVDLVDDQKLRLGTSNDLQIFHQSSGSFNQIQGASGVNTRIRQLGNGGALYLAATNIYFQNHNNNQTFLHAVNNGAVKLNYSGSTKFETTNAGINVEGSVTADDIITAGALLHEDDTDTLVHFSAANTIQLKTGGSSRLLVNNFGINLENGYLNSNGNRIILGDSSGATDDRIIFGNNNDLEIYHDGTASFIKNATGGLNIEDTGGYFRVKSDDIKLEAANGEDFLECDANGAVILYHDASKKFETISSGVQVSGTLFIPDGGQASNRISIGNSGDLQVFHDGSNSKIVEGGTGSLIIQTSNFNLDNADGTENILTATENGAVELYFDGSKKAETDSFGFEVIGEFRVGSATHSHTHFNYQDGGNNYITQGNSSQTFFRNASGTVRTQIQTDGHWRWKDGIKAEFGDSDDLQIFHDGSDSFVQNSTGQLILRTATVESAIVCEPNAAVSLYHDNSKKFETTSSGVTVTGQITQTSAGAQNSHKFGSANPFFYGQFNSSGDASINNQASASLLFATANTERMRITSDGPHLLLGGTTDVNEITESSANAGMVIGGTGFGNAGLAIITSTSGTGRLYFGDNTGSNAGRNRGQINYGHSDDHMRFVTAGTERMRIKSNGFIGIGTSTVNHHLVVSADSTNLLAGQFLQNNTSFTSTVLQAACSRNTTNGSYSHFKCSINGVADKMRVLDSGAIQSTSNSIGGISDERLKENIVDAGSQWDDIKNIRVRKFNFKKLTDPEQKTMLGVVAQEAETVCPGLVESTVQLQEGVEQEYKSFKYSILYMKAIKCLQEAMAKIEVLETEVAALKAS